jgi:3-methyladenine DNA glycosylase AlkD
MKDNFIEYARNELAKNHDGRKAREMAAYMKTDMPFYGVSAPMRDEIMREALRRHPIASINDLERVASSFWSLPHREEKAIATRLLHVRKKWISLDLLPLYERMIREGAWWDLVDEIATHVMGALWLAHPEIIAPLMDRWIEDEDLWIRRTAIIGQLKNKKRTDETRLFAYCRRCAPETDFFIRKAIGWALREYSKTSPDAVSDFIDSDGDRLSPLSLREAKKYLPKEVRS